MLPSENRRERVLTREQEAAYLAAAEPALRDVALILLDLGLRPEECYRLKVDNIREGAVEIFAGKRDASRRLIPASQRVLGMIDMHLSAPCASGWLFPAPTKSGHIEASSLRKVHLKAWSARSSLTTCVILASRDGRR